MDTDGFVVKRSNFTLATDSPSTAYTVSPTAEEAKSLTLLLR